jgi:hypothetical protein
MDNHQDGGSDRPRFGTLEANWENFNAVDIAPAAPNVQRREMRRAFMAGGASALVLAVDAHVYGDFTAAMRNLQAELGTYLAIADAKRHPPRNTDEADAHTAENLVDTIKPAFAGLPPAVQGAALADLLAIWIAGHDPELREKVLEIHIEGVRALVPHNDPRQQHGS